MRRGTYLLLLVLAVALTFGNALSVNAAQSQVFAKANQDFDQGHFQEAIDGYETLVRSGQWSVNLFYDLGNAWFRKGDFGQAILNYERALRLDPRHPETQANLQLARDAAHALELEKNFIERYVDAGTTKQYSILASIAFWLAIFGAARLFFSGRRSVALITLVILSLSVFAGALGAIYVVETGCKGKALAIVIGKKVEARLATADSAKSVLSLPPGTQVKILSERGDWIYAALPNDLRGWIPANTTERVRL